MQQRQPGEIGLVTSVNIIQAPASTCQSSPRLPPKCRGDKIRSPKKRKLLLLIFASSQPTEALKDGNKRGRHPGPGLYCHSVESGTNPALKLSAPK